MAEASKASEADETKPPIICWKRAAEAWERIADLHRREARRAEKAAFNCRQRAGVHIAPLSMEEAAAIAAIAEEEGARDATY